LKKLQRLDKKWLAVYRKRGRLFDVAVHLWLGKNSFLQLFAEIL